MTVAVALTAALLLTAPQDDERALTRIVESGVEEGVYPGAVVVAGTGDAVLYAAGVGHLTWAATSPVPDAAATLWDLASLTKVVATTTAAMVLVDRGALDLDRAVQEYLPAFRGAGKERVTVRLLLEHRSGLRAFLPLHERAGSAEEARELVLAEPLRYAPGGRVEYSDLNGMLLGWVVEAAAGVPLDVFVRDQVFRPLGMEHTGFRPDRAARASAAPVGLWRGHAIAGELHDQNAVRLGGVSGHAGLYSTGADLARLAQLLLRGGVLPDGTRFLRSATIEHFTRRGAGNRALGWEMPDTTTTDNHGALLSPFAFGHTGFTGTSLWIDPSEGLFVVVLTNRVFAPRVGGSITRLKRIRGAIADGAVRVRDRWCRDAAPPGDAACR